MISNVWKKLPAAVAGLALLAPALSTAAENDRIPARKPTAAEAKAFVERLDRELRELWIRASTAEWIKATHITDDTERNAAYANEDLMAYLSRALLEAQRFEGAEVDPTTRRMLEKLKFTTPVPAPSDPAQRAELAQIMAKLDGIYGKGKWCGEDGKGQCRDLGQLSETIARSRDWDELVDAWAGWRTISREMRPLYVRQVELANAGAREIGFRDLAEHWRAGYDMSPEAFEQETERLWKQVEPLYEQLHCYVRDRLRKHYGDRVPANGPIPAHVLGNMWAQEWTNIYPLVEPYPGHASLDVDGALREQGWDHQRMVKLGEKFFTSIGLNPLPATFWERSQFVKPEGREVICHASAWNVTLDNDLRIKMCIKPTEEDLVTIHHELGHNYYYMYYGHLPVIFQEGAHDGFHEAIGDAIALSITPGYLEQVGLLEDVPDDDKGEINVQMKMALSKIAFLPFGKLIDQWRWDVFSGKVKPEEWNAHWWRLRERYQGVAAPVKRTEADFDPGAKYHIPGNTPYMRYFLAHILQFQMHEALCRAAGHEGPLHTCSIYGSEEAGKKLQAMLALGSSKPWPDALEALTGTREMDARPLVEYFAPLRAWLETQNAGKTCGW